MPAMYTRESALTRALTGARCNTPGRASVFIVRTSHGFAEEEETPRKLQGSSKSRKERLALLETQGRGTELREIALDGIVQARQVTMWLC